MVFRSEDVIVKTISRILVPFIQLYALYVIMHGHYSPGGGFQGGVILAASFILMLLTYGYGETKERISERLVNLLSSIGVLIYAGIGLLCLLLLGNFLDYSQLARILPVEAARARSLGILGVELGVGMAVMAVMISIFLDISSGGVVPDDTDAGDEE